MRALGPLLLVSPAFAAGPDRPSVMVLFRPAEPVSEEVEMVLTTEYGKTIRIPIRDDGVIPDEAAGDNTWTGANWFTGESGTAVLVVGKQTYEGGTYQIPLATKPKGLSAEIVDGKLVLDSNFQRGGPGPAPLDPGPSGGAAGDGPGPGGAPRPGEPGPGGDPNNRPPTPAPAEGQTVEPPPGVEPPPKDGPSPDGVAPSPRSETEGGMKAPFAESSSRSTFGWDREAESGAGSVWALVSVVAALGVGIAGFFAGVSWARRRSPPE